MTTWPVASRGVRMWGRDEDSVLRARSGTPRTAPGPATGGRPKAEAEKKTSTPGTIDRDAWVSLGIGFGLAVVALAVPWIRFVIYALMTVIHELGHTATAWLFASPSMPSFDLTFGGGLSHIFARQPLLVVAAYAIFAFLLFRARGDRIALINWAAAALLYTVAMFSPLRAVLITAMDMARNSCSRASFSTAH